MKPPDYDFLSAMGRVLNSGQARSIVLTGNVTEQERRAWADEIRVLERMGIT